MTFCIWSPCHSWLPVIVHNANLDINHPERHWVVRLRRVCVLVCSWQQDNPFWLADSLHLIVFYELDYFAITRHSKVIKLYYSCSRLLIGRVYKTYGICALSSAHQAIRFILWVYYVLHVFDTTTPTKPKYPYPIKCNYHKLEHKT